MQISLYHNPRCSKSRAALALLRDAGVEPTLIDYLNTPPSLDSLTLLVGLLGLSPRALLRTREAEYQTLNLAQPDLTDAAILTALHQHPRLLERPIAVRDDIRAVIGRPPERVLELLDHG
ncbi:MAG: arsenate reductase (glutaredoxin) [Candidatus Macondimonas sp.]|jgi:arsenate reductase